MAGLDIDNWTNITAYAGMIQLNKRGSDIIYILGVHTIFDYPFISISHYLDRTTFAIMTKITNGVNNEFRLGVQNGKIIITNVTTNANYFLEDMQVSNKFEDLGFLQIYHHDVPQSLYVGVITRYGILRVEYGFLNENFRIYMRGADMFVAVDTTRPSWEHHITVLVDEKTKSEIPVPILNVASNWKIIQNHIVLCTIGRVTMALTFTDTEIDHEPIESIGIKKRHHGLLFSVKTSKKGVAPLYCIVRGDTSDTYKLYNVQNPSAPPLFCVRPTTELVDIPSFCEPTLKVQLFGHFITPRPSFLEFVTAGNKYIVENDGKIVLPGGFTFIVSRVSIHAKKSYNMYCIGNQYFVTGSAIGCNHSLVTTILPVSHGHRVKPALRDNDSN